jgi:hypothetical protein
MLNVYIKPATLSLNGKVELSHLSDQCEFYQILDYEGDADLRQKIGQPEDYYNYLRYRSAHAKKLVKC